MEEKEKKAGLFDMIDMVQGAKTPWNDLPEDYQKAYSPYMINRFLSSKEQFVGIIERLSTLKLTNEQHYGIVCQLFNSQRKIFFDYKSYKVPKVTPEIDLLIFAFTKEYECGKREAKMYINNISNEESDYLKKKWKDLYENMRVK